MIGVTRDLVLVSHVKSPREPLALPRGFHAAIVRGNADPDWPLLQQFYEAHHFPADWPGKMLCIGGVAHLLVSDKGEPIGAGWETAREFYVEEIGRTFDPGEGNVYFFGDLIAPSCRGQGLHRQLVRLRVDSSHAGGRQWMMAMIRSDNLPSIGGYRREGFLPVAELRTRRRAGWRVDAVRRILPELPFGVFSAEGFLLPGLGRIRRA